VTALERVVLVIAVVALVAVGAVFVTVLR